MTAAPQAALRWARTRRAGFLRVLRELVEIPTVSADPGHAGDVRRGAEWLARHLRRIGLPDVVIVDTAGHPVVRGAWRGAPHRPTLLVYGHYDVQPAGPPDAWRTPPFAARRRGDWVVGRGTSDNKGQLLAHLAAIEAYLRTSGALPVNVVCMLDGEEEIGSPHLPGVLARECRADLAVVSDTRMAGRGRPAIVTALRGSVTAELEVRGPPRALHSGTYGGAVHNPITALCALIGTLHDTDGAIAIPGFYRHVRELDPDERAAVAMAGPTDRAVLDRAGVTRGRGERGFTAFERTTVRPALDVHGITGGHQGPGNSSIIPPSATAKLGLRLVPDQRPDEIAAMLRRHVARQVPGGIRARLRITGRTPPVRTDPTHPAVDAAIRACERGYGATPVLVPSGGTIPAVGQLATTLGVETVLLGFALPGDGSHGPNERAHLPTLFRAADTCVWLLHELAAQDLATGDWFSASRTPATIAALELT
ncbi:MAG TPA: M20/M25/M40 family metallo-hydrolase [Actinophytocola sp.]|uniref:M20/M25/M40 family metallo-hydrolase n=1 Tax=Actinophytocola sp. TaxID=1872138 RepID=UPI002E01FD92|nr:M20/M25/M40 family metallo-hydrolase [Actinophytocola sp.]